MQILYEIIENLIQNFCSVRFLFHPACLYVSPDILFYVCTIHVDEWEPHISCAEET